MPRRVSRVVFALLAVASVAVGAEPPPSVAFAPRSARPAGAAGFTLLPPAHTGVSAFNAYDDPAMWAQRYREFSLGAIGTGVALADYDGDGRLDLFVVRKTGPNHLFRNLGDCRFEDVTARAGVGGEAGPWQQGVAWADVNNDGRPDLYVCRFAAPNLLYVNQGDGTFREEAAARGLALTDASGMAAFCDYDRDGWLDVYVQTNVLDAERRPNGQRDRLYRNRGDGTFVDVTDAAGIRGDTQGHSATWWDYDEDGWPDLYVANDFKDPDQLYHNNRDGTFANALSYVVPHTPHSSMGADLGDVDNDGHADLLVADMAATTRVKDHRGMAKLRTGLTENEQRPKAAPQYMRNALFLGTGTGRVLEAATLAGLDATDWTWSVRLEDLDQDGRLDAHFTNGMVRELHGTDLIQRAQAFESGADRIRLMKASPPLAERHLAFRNLGDLRFEDVGAAWGLDRVGVGFGAAFGDLDGDGDLDLVYASYEADVTIARNDVATGHGVIFDLRGRASNRFGVGATVRIETAAGAQMRTLTLARGYLSTSEPAVHFGLGAENRVARVTVEWPSGRRQEFTDLAADRRYTLTESDAPPVAAPPAPAPWLVEDAGFAARNVTNRERPFPVPDKEGLTPFYFQRPGPSATLADLDGDGLDELALGGVAGEPAQLLSNLGDGEFLPYGSGAFSDRAAVADGPLLAFDADADGDLDLLATKAGVAAPAGSSAYQPRLLLNDGRGRLAAAPAGLLPELSLSVGAAAAADFEHTGRLGVFLGARLTPGRYPQTPRSVLLAWRGDRYADVTDELAPGLATRGLVTAALWSDVDGDGWSELLVVYEWGGLACYRNTGGRLEDATAALGFDGAGAGWWRSLVAGDFNHDGRPDFALGNIGLNTRYRADAATPLRCYAGVMLGGTQPQLIETHTAEDGRVYPWATRETLLKVFPSLARRFPTAESYAVASLAEVFPPEALAGATLLTVTELRSGIFLSQPDSRYRWSPLPRRAQLAPIHGLLATDVDADGRLDLLAVGNAYGQRPEIGRFDGGVGWWLRGDGQGGFTPVPPAESGWLVTGDARALAQGDLDQDGAPDYIATRSNDRALRFRPAPVAGRARFGVALRGPAGNPTAVGARLTLTLADGSAQSAEVTAGAGYLSQSGGTQFFSYPADLPPARLTVRWPNGQTTEHLFTTPPPKTLRLAAP